MDKTQKAEVERGVNCVIMKASFNEKPVNEGILLEILSELLLKAMNANSKRSEKDDYRDSVLQGVKKD